MEQINQYKLRITSFTSELTAPIDPEKRTIIQTEVELYETSLRDNNDGTFDKIYRGKVVGATDCTQGDKVLKGKSKRTQSQKLRNVIYARNPSEEYYEEIMGKIIGNIDEVIHLLAN